MSNIEEELEISISDGCYITTRWLAFKHNIKMIDAEKICENYLSQNEVHASYLVSGKRRVEDESVEITLARKDTLEDTKKEFSVLHSVQIFALYKHDTESLSTQLSSMNQSQVAAMLVNCNDALMRNTCGRIRHPSLTIHAMGSRTFAPKDVAPAPLPVKKTASAPSSTHTTTPAAKQTAKAVASFFDKAPATKPVAKPAATSPTTTAVSSTPNPPKEDSDDDGEWDNANKTDKSKIKKRETYHATDEIVEQPEEVEDIAPASPEKKQKRHVHGAMDDILEDMALAGSLQASPVKKKRKKLVEKMFSDEKGYLVTQMVWEEVTDDEAPPPKKIEAVAPKKAASVPVASKKKKDDKGAGQKSMMSFFSKK